MHPLGVVEVGDVLIDEALCVEENDEGMKPPALEFEVGQEAFGDGGVLGGGIEGHQTLCVRGLGVVMWEVCPQSEWRNAAVLGSTSGAA